MRPKERRETGQTDLFRARLDQIVDLTHPLAKLARAIDWGCLEERFGGLDSDGPGPPPLPTRLMAGLALLKHRHDLSDEVLRERWGETPSMPLFGGEEFFGHKRPFDRSSMTRWRQRRGEERLMAFLPESLSVATRTGAAKPADFRPVIIDTTVQEKAITFPPDAKLMHRAHAPGQGTSGAMGQGEGGRPASVLCAGGQAGPDPAPALGPCQAVQPGPKPFNRANTALRRLRTMLGRVIRGIPRKIRGDETLESVFARPLSLARRVREQRQRERGRKLSSLHAPEGECIGRGKAPKPYEFGVKVSGATPLNRCRGGPFVAHGKALPGNPYDGP